MKTLIKTLVSATLCVVVLSSASMATVKPNISHATLRAATPKFQKIHVDGNVDLVLVQNGKEGVIVDTESKDSQLKVTQKGNTLNIQSRDPKRVKITVYVDEIYRIQASGNSSVKTFGRLTLKNLQVFLDDNALADINAQTEGLYTVVNDASKLNLEGTTGHHALVKGKKARLTTQDFLALKSEISYNEAVAMLNK